MLRIIYNYTMVTTLTLTNSGPISPVIKAKLRREWQSIFVFLDKFFQAYNQRELVISQSKTKLAATIGQTSNAMTILPAKIAQNLKTEPMITEDDRSDRETKKFLINEWFKLLKFIEQISAAFQNKLITSSVRGLKNSLAKILTQLETFPYRFADLLDADITNYLKENPPSPKDDFLLYLEKMNQSLQNRNITRLARQIKTLRSSVSFSHLNHPAYLDHIEKTRSIGPLSSYLLRYLISQALPPEN